MPGEPLTHNVSKLKQVYARLRRAKKASEGGNWVYITPQLCLALQELLRQLITETGAASRDRDPD